MASLIDDMPVYARRADEIEAALYNLWRRARARFGAPLRLAMPAFKGVALVLEERAWVCINLYQNELPILAWVDFEDEGRAALHTPVACHLNYYHYAASKLRGPALELMQHALADRLAATLPGMRTRPEDA